MVGIKRMSFLAALALFCASFCLAQDSPAQQDPPTQAAPAPQASTTSADSSGTIQGCLSGSDGNYMLAQDGTGAMFKLVGSDHKLKGHVGHEVMVTGEVSGAASAASADQSPNDPAASGTGTSAGGNTVQVSDVKMVSKHCSSGGGSQPNQ